MTGARDELGRLGAALGAELRRRRAMGWRRIPSPAPVAPGVTTQPSQARSPAPPAPAASQPAQAARPASDAPGTPAPVETPEPVAAAPEAAASDLAQRIAEVQARADQASNLDELRAAVAGCRACSLSETRSQTVFADGDGSDPILFVGEAPGYHEDAQGIPFVGPSGKLLTDIIEKGMRRRRDRVTICNVLKCRPPENRDPTAEEKALCTPWLDRQIELSNPRVIIPLGRHAAGHLLQSDASLGQLRGRVHKRRGRPVVPTYHPAYLLRNPELKRACWQDIQLAMGELDPPPA